MMMLRLFSVIPTVRVFLFSTALAFSFGLTTVASAALSISVTGVAGAPTSTWTFSGGYDIPIVNGTPGGPLNVPGAFDMVSNGGLGTLSGQLNNWQGNDFTSPLPFYDGPYNKSNIDFGAGISVLASGSPILGTPAIPHNVTGFNLESLPRFTWFADGPWFGLDTLTFSGSAVAQFDVGLLSDIVGVGDVQVITANTPALGVLTMSFNAVAGQIPEPSSALLIGLGLAAMGASKRRAGTAASV
jgi:hypothetical protein